MRIKQTQNYSWIWLILLLLWLGSGCSNTRYLGENQQLYVGANLDIQSEVPVPKKGALKMELDEVLIPEPNSTVFGLRPSLWFYNIAGDPDTSQGLWYFVKYKLGNPPVLFEDVRPEYVSKLIQNRLYNYGFFNAEVDHQVKTVQKKKVRVRYIAEISQPYSLDTIRYLCDSTGIGQALDTLQVNSLLKTGQPYKLSTLKAERERIDTALKNRGYFFFDTEYLHITADTTVGPKKLNLYIGVDDDIPLEAGTAFRIKNVFVYPNYHLGEDAVRETLDTVIKNKHIYLGFDENNRFRPAVLERSIFLEPGELYSRRAHEMTLTRLMGLNAFKYVDVRFSRSDTSQHTNWLDARIYITPMKKKTLRAELEVASKSNNYAGPGIKGSWQNRNVFGGAELLTINPQGGFETQIGGEQFENLTSNLASFNVSLGIELNFPRFVAPFNIKVNSLYVPRTHIKASYELINRLEYFKLNSISFNYGYRWQSNRTIEQELNPLNVAFSQISNTTDEFDELLEANPLLDQSFSEQFIVGPEYKFTFNNQMESGRRPHYYFSAGFDAGDPFNLLGKTFTEYARITTDFRYYLNVTDESKLAARFATGVGIPYGESETMPYIKQFFTGGPNGNRAFRARTVGPGTYQPDTTVINSGFFDQSGDIKLELNLEYRFTIYSVLKGAVFADAGNIWLLNENPSQPGGKFQFKDTFKELAMGVGAGLRLDGSFFVLRLDLGWPIRKPFLPEGDRWVSDWYKETPVLNISIGYPF